MPIQGMLTPARREWLKDHVAVGISVLGVLIVWVGVIVDRIEDRQGYVDRAIDETTAIAATVEAHFAQALYRFDQLVVTARLEGASERTTRLIQEILRIEHLTEAIDGVSLFDAAGDLLIATARHSSVKVNVADRA